MAAHQVDFRHLQGQAFRSGGDGQDLVGGIWYNEMGVSKR